MTSPHDHSSVVIKAPLSGELMRLECISDPVFSQKMVGDGIAIDPIDQILCAPCDGQILQIHPAGHAVTLVTLAGIQVLMHIGLDTVALTGQGFRPKIKRGDHVVMGTPLVEFDLDFLATHAKSLLTPIVITNSDIVASFTYASGMVKVAEDSIFTLVLKEHHHKLPEGLDQHATSHTILISNPMGMHARPSAMLANLAKTFRSDIRLHLREKHANAKSITAIMGLDVAHAAKVILVARGPDAAESVAKLTELLEKGLKDHYVASTFIGTATTSISPPAPVRRIDVNLIAGVTAAPGIGVGNAFQVRHEELTVIQDANHPDERELLDGAIERAKGQLAALQSQLRAGLDPEKADIFAAHAELIEDPALQDFAVSAIARGKSAAYAWKSAFESSANVIADMPNRMLAQRADDLRDVGRRVLELLTGVERKPRQFPRNAILITEELMPSDTAFLDRTRVKGFCTTRGGATSHVAILASSLGIPALAGVEPRALEVPDGTLVILDASGGFLRLNASLAEMHKILEAQKLAEERYELNLARAHEPAITLDGKRIEVAANIDRVADAARVAVLGAEGVGLLRSEFLFLERASAPTEDEQFEAYKAVADAIGPARSLIIRTLDVGGDKALAYLPIPAEDNPFLGERGIRVGLDRPEILRTQLRAILRASAFGKVMIMFPMVATLDELRAAKAILSEEAERLGVSQVPVGIMVEIPATAVMAEQFAKEADFFSVGTNDLAQYTLAMDRGHPKLAPYVDGLNPAVLRLIAQSVVGAHSRGKWVGVCGGIAGDAHAVPLLVGLGIDELSVSLPAIPTVKAQIRSLRLTECRQLAEQVLECETAADARALVAARSDGNTS